MGQGPLGWLQLLDLAAIQLALALVLGGWASSRWLLGAGSPWAARCANRTKQASRFGAVLGLVGQSGAAWLQAAVMAEVSLGQTGPAVVTLLRDTHYGHVAFVGFAAWCVALLVVWQGRMGLALLLGLFVTAWSRSAVSHAANSGDYSFDVAVDIVHILATLLWVGMVLIAANMPKPRSVMPERVDAGRWVAALSSYATVALAAVVATGLFKAYRAVPDWSLLPASDYGRALFVKLGLVAAAVVLGGYNKFKVLPPLLASLSQRGGPSPDNSSWTRRLLAVLRIEMAVLVLVVGWAAILASTEPPG